MVLLQRFFSQAYSNQYKTSTEDKGSFKTVEFIFLLDKLISNHCFNHMT